MCHFISDLPHNANFGIVVYSKPVFTSDDINLACLFSTAFLKKKKRENGIFYGLFLSNSSPTTAIAIMIAIVEIERYISIGGIASSDVVGVDSADAIIDISF